MGRLFNRDDLMISTVFLLGLLAGTYGTLFVKTFETTELRVAEPIIAQLDIETSNPELKWDN